MFDLDLTAQDRFVMRQRVRLVINQYEFSVPDESADGEPFCFVEQKRFKFKEDIRFYADESKERELLRILARQRFDPRARYDVALADGTKLGEIQKVFGRSLWRSTYVVYGADGEEVARAHERSVPVAIFRRVIGLVPFIGEFLEFLPIAYDFEFFRDEQLIGTHRRRRWQWRDVYDLDFSADAARVLDRRLILAIAVGMDALQAR